MTPTTQAPVIVWLRRTLRLADNPVLAAAVATGRPVVPVYLHTPKANEPFALGAASAVWLHHSLTHLSASFAALGAPLVLRQGECAVALLTQLATETNAHAIFFDKRIEAPHQAEEQALAQALPHLHVQGWFTNLLVEPRQVLNATSGEVYKVFTPFWKAATKVLNPPEPLPAPAVVQGLNPLPVSLRVDELGLLPATLSWHHGLEQSWTIGEAAAQQRWAGFKAKAIGSYYEERNIPSVAGTSQLSPHLHFGEISPRQLWHDVCQGQPYTALPKDPQHYLSELGWREFAHQLLAAYPTLATEPLNPKFNAFPWRNPATDPEAAELFSRWCKGQTGYPIVDAAMRQLWHTGWMHNRTRMIVASFLVKHLLIDWRAGERWFWDTLVDADPANNVLSWQWVAGCGADAAPYVRVFNPVLQSQKFDPKGAYIRRWVPELAKLTNSQCHEPWLLKPLEARLAGVVLGETYPWPVVDHIKGRDAALAAYDVIKGT